MWVARLWALASFITAFCVGPAIAQQQAGGDLARDYLNPLRAASCPADVEYAAADAVVLNVVHVPLQGVNPARKVLGDLTFVDGFQLSSPDARFGGLSGLDLLPDGNLLAVSDQGDFVWIDLDAAGLTPVAARIAALRGADSEVVRGKADGDAEGLAVNDGLALVAFERNHRVLAYDIGACGAVARGASIVFGPYGEAMPAAFAEAGLQVSGNAGAEALAVSPDWYLFTGLESPAEEAGPVSARAIESPPAFDVRIGRGSPPLVGLDVLPAGPDGRDLLAYSLHRSTNPLATRVISLVETRFTRVLDQAGLPARVTSEIDERSHVRFRPASSRVLADMNVFVTIDNFEGVAAQRMPDGGVRLYVVADDNFSASQRTLLMIYDLRP